MKIFKNVFTPYHYTSENVEKMLEKYLKPGDSVLDVGTGTGILAIMAKKHGAGRILAVDIQDEAVACATENFKDKGYDIECKKNYLNFDISEQFDVTIANLYANPAIEFIQYAKATMKDDGILILTWPSFCVGDLRLKEAFDILEHTTDQEYNVYVLRKD